MKAYRKLQDASGLTGKQTLRYTRVADYTRKKGSFKLKIASHGCCRLAIFTELPVMFTTCWT